MIHCFYRLLQIPVHFLLLKPTLSLSILLFSLFLLPAISSCFAQEKIISLTIDDLPFVGESRSFHLKMIIEAMKKEQIPATGFIIAREVRSQDWDILTQFRDAGFSLGNHTFSHLNLNKTPSKHYIQDIQQADSVLTELLTQPKYFRYPYLAIGTEDKKQKVLNYLAKKNYTIAPITIDSKDFIFNQRLLAIPEAERRTYFEELKPFYLEFIWQQTLNAEKNKKNGRQGQILLIHANLLNAYVLPEIISLYKQKGYRFVTLEEALSKPSVAQAEKSLMSHNDTKIESFIAWD